MRSSNAGGPGPETSRQTVDATWLASWLKAFQQQQFEQTKYLRNISTVATIIGVLTVLSVVAGASSVLMGY
jgi:hypothetical protein